MAYDARQLGAMTPYPTASNAAEVIFGRSENPLTSQRSVPSSTSPSSLTNCPIAGFGRIVEHCFRWPAQPRCPSASPRSAG